MWRATCKIEWCEPLYAQRRVFGAFPVARLACPTPPIGWGKAATSLSTRFPVRVLALRSGVALRLLHLNTGGAAGAAPRPRACSLATTLRLFSVKSGRQPVPRAEGEQKSTPRIGKVTKTPMSGWKPPIYFCALFATPRSRSVWTFEAHLRGELFVR